MDADDESTLDSVIDELIKHCRDVKKNRCKLVEELLLEINKPLYLYFYAMEVIDGRWEKAEDRIKMDSVIWRDYLNIGRVSIIGILKDAMAREGKILRTGRSTPIGAIAKSSKKT